MSDIELRLARLEELFSVPEAIVAIVARSPKERSQQDYQMVVAWLMEPERRQFLLTRARHALAREFGTNDVEQAGAIVEAFYIRRIRDIVRKARPDTFASEILIAFDKYARRRVDTLVLKRLRDLTVLHKLMPRDLGEVFEDLK